jgi:hypothetical protein
LQTTLSSPGSLGNSTEGRIGEGVSDVLSFVGDAKSRAQGVIVKEAALCAAVLADYIAEQVGFGGVVGDRVARVVEFFDDVVLNSVPEVVDDGHD